MEKVEFDLQTLLGDILSKDGLYVDLLSCNEYTIWYLIRQAGLHGYVPALHTKTFFSEYSLMTAETFTLYQDDNLRVVIANLQKYFGVGIVQYDESKGTIEEFIRNGIGNGQFVYTLYDYYYDTLVDEARTHDYHGHPITGCDDGRQIYLSILNGKYEVKYDDMKMMSKDCYERFGTYIDKYFYLDSHIAEARKLLWINEISIDCRCMLDDWQKELDCFRSYITELPKALQYSKEKQVEFSLQQRKLFNSMAEGMHGNFIFKLRLIQEIFEIDTCELQKRFLSNRKKCIMIANMYRKVSILLDDSQEYFALNLNRIVEKVSEIFIRESEELHLAFNTLVKKEGLI